MFLISICFFLSGFCSLLYQIVWLRMAMARFGVNAPVISTVLSVFMLGLSLGSFLAGKIAERAAVSKHFCGLRAYALAEAFIGLGGLTVPIFFTWGRDSILSLSMSNSLTYFTAGFIMVFLALIPFCTAMGATFPLALSYLKRLDIPGKEFNFSYLYLTNVAGALLGVFLPTVFTIELFGFKDTLWFGIIANFLIAGLAFFYGSKITDPIPRPSNIESVKSNEFRPAATKNIVSLFCLGLVSLGLEVVWTRFYTPYIGTFVYSFALILVVYLFFTLTGTCIYRWTSLKDSPWILWICIGPAAALSLLSCNPDVHLTPFFRVVIGLAPFCFITGFLTPSLIDSETRSHPEAAGFAYAVNLMGCIAGPLIAGFILIPLWGSRWSCIVLAFCLLIVAYFNVRDYRTEKHHERLRLNTTGYILSIILFFVLIIFNRTFEERFENSIILHDHTATVMANGKGMSKNLYVNGKSITHLTTITKLMVHLPMAHLSHTPESGVVLCMGMGTSFRSLVSWNVDATVVELVPSVAKLFPYFFDDADSILHTAAHPARIIVDDARRFLDRTDQTFDMVTIDPPPPVEAAASSLLYSVEFYKSIKRSLKNNGILQTWLPGGDQASHEAVIHSLLRSFVYVRMFGSIEGWGYHFLASDMPIPKLSAEELAGSLPETARKDITEWIKTSPVNFFKELLKNEKDPKILLSFMGGKEKFLLTDDRPVNEYYLLRRFFLPEKHSQ